MFNEETTAGIMVTKDSEEIAMYVSIFFRFLNMLVDFFKGLYAAITGK